MEEDVEEKAWDILHLYGHVLGVQTKVDESWEVRNCSIAHCEGIMDFIEESMCHTKLEYNFWRNVRDKIRLL